MIKPTYGNCVVRVLTEDKITKGGIVIPDKVSLMGFAIMAEIVAVNDSDGYTKGEKVLFKKYNSIDVEVDGEELSIIPCKEILAVIE